MAPSTTAATLSEEIDQLLERYLELLDQYTTLRSQLSSLQSAVYQNISRANFSAERGIRYGADFYDARMQASRVCGITHPATEQSTTDVQQEDNVVAGQSLDDVERPTTAVPTAATSVVAEGLKEKERRGTASTAVATTCFTISTAPKNGTPPDTAHAAGDGKGEDARTPRAPRDPLRMFGLLAPSAMRQAQKESVRMVDEIVPRILEVDAEMKEVEIRIRRARKWKAKAEIKERTLNEKGIHETAPREELVLYYLAA